MGLQIGLSLQQINGIASHINKKEVYDYVNSNKEAYEKYLKNEEKQNTEDKTFASNNSVFSFYTDDTICKVNIDKNYMKGSKLNGEL